MHHNYIIVNVRFGVGSRHFERRFKTAAMCQERTIQPNGGVTGCLVRCSVLLYGPFIPRGRLSWSNVVRDEGVTLSTRFMGPEVMRIFPPRVALELSAELVVLRWIGGVFVWNVGDRIGRHAGDPQTINDVGKRLWQCFMRQPVAVNGAGQRF